MIYTLASAKNKEVCNLFKYFTPPKVLYDRKLFHKFFSCGSVAVFYDINTLCWFT